MSKTERLYIRLTPELKEQLQKAAEAQNRTVSNYIEHLVKQDLSVKSNSNPQSSL